jgi:tight adherence protein C
LLRLQADECWELRKLRAKQLGEEASAKLLIPMMIMFVGILIIVVLPAVLQLNSL